MIFCTTHLPNFYPVNLLHFNYKHLLSTRVKSSVDPNQMASSEAVFSGLTFKKNVNMGSAKQWLIFGKNTHTKKTF